MDGLAWIWNGHSGHRPSGLLEMTINISFHIMNQTTRHKTTTKNHKTATERHQMAIKRDKTATKRNCVCFSFIHNIHIHTSHSFILTGIHGGPLPACSGRKAREHHGCQSVHVLLWNNSNLTLNILQDLHLNIKSVFKITHSLNPSVNTALQKRPTCLLHWKT